MKNLLLSKTSLVSAVIAALFLILSPAFASEDPDNGDAGYWFEKGGLYSAYGNEKAAIESFHKVLALEPDNMEAAFNLGISYAEKGRYDNALDFINRALSRHPEKGVYLYGRGWVLLKEGQREKALDDIRKAAEIGNPDAVRYINEIAPRSDRTKY